MPRSRQLWTIGAVAVVSLAFGLAASLSAGGLAYESGRGPLTTGPNPFSPPPLTEEDLGAIVPPRTEGHPKLESALAQLADTYAREGLSQASAFSEARSIALAGELVRLVATVETGREDEVLEAIVSLGGVLETSYGREIQFSAPLAALQPIADLPGVSYVAQPNYPVAQAVTSEGVNVVGANAWQAAGFKGKGVKVGVADLGFAGYTGLLGSELPASVTARSFRPDGDISGGGEVHGTAVAEIIYDLAPEAGLYFANLRTTVEMGNAVDWLIAQGVSIISASIGSSCSAPGDGTGTANDIVAKARKAGVLWVNAAGNEGDRHWSGTFTDPDGDGWHNFAPNDEGNSIQLTAGTRISICLMWDDWTQRTEDFDLYLARSDTQEIVAYSENPQRGSLPPVERLDYLVPTDGQYFIAIAKYKATRSVDFDLFIHLSGQPCAATTALQDEPQGGGTLGALRTLRDKVLLRSGLGQRYVNLFYKHSLEVSRILLLDADLRSRIASFLTRMTPAYQSLLSQGDPGGDLPRVTWDIVREAEGLLWDLSKPASSSLQADLRDVWESMSLYSAQGKTFKELWERLESGRPAPTSPSPGELQYKVAARSLIIPADSSNSLTVGATYWKDDTLMSYSSQGPTRDGRTKPDLAGPTGVSTQSYRAQGTNEFHGTSSSTPHVSGVAALVKSAFPSHGPSELQAYLEAQALDLGPTGKDNKYGSGRLRLPALQVTPTPTATPTRTPTPTPTSTPFALPARPPDFQDDFLDNRNGWDLTPIGQVYLEGGKLHIDNQTLGSAIYTVPTKSPEFSGVVYESEVTKVAGPEIGAFGLQFAYTTNEASYAFLVSGDGSYSLQYWPGSPPWSVRKDWTPSTALNRSNNVNRLRVLVSATSIELYANDALLAVVQDSAAKSGRIGLIVGNYGVHASFGKVRAWSVSQTPTPTPTPTRTPTPTPTPTYTPTPSPASPTPTPTATPLPLPTPTPSPITLPDLYVLPEDIWTSPMTIRQGDKTGLGASVRNRGSVTAGKVGATIKVDFFHGNPSGGGKKIGSGSVPAISPFGLAAVRMSETWDTLGVVGARDVYAVVDPANEIGESNENNNSAVRTVHVLPPAADTLPPQGTVSINGGAPSTSTRQVTLSLDGQDEGGSGVQHMYVSEVVFDTIARQWISVQDSDWKTYFTAYPWILTEGSGAKYVRVWFADGAGNIANSAAKAMINYVAPSNPIAAGEWALYRHSFEAGTLVTVTLNTIAGDADLFVWWPGNASSPDYYSVNSGLANDTVTFAAPISGTYQIQVYGFEASSYAISIATVGASFTGMALHPASEAGRNVGAAKTMPASPLTTSEPVGEQAVPPVEFKVYLPLAVRNLTGGW